MLKVPFATAGNGRVCFTSTCLDTYTHRHAHVAAHGRASSNHAWQQQGLCNIHGVLQECNRQLTIGIPLLYQVRLCLKLQGFRFAADRHRVAASASVRSLDLALKIPWTLSTRRHLYMCGPSVDEQIPQSTIVALCVLECPVAVEVGPPLTASFSSNTEDLPPMEHDRNASVPKLFFIKPMFSISHQGSDLGKQASTDGATGALWKFVHLGGRYFFASGWLIPWSSEKGSAFRLEGAGEHECGKEALL